MGREKKGETDLIIAAMVIDDVDGLDDVGVLESGTHAEFCGDFFLVLLLALACALGPELLDSVDGTAVLALDETDGAASAAAEDAAPFSVLF
jgi:hypothetical protein